MKKQDFTIVGTRPLLMHRFSAEPKQTNSIGVIDYSDEAEKACYRLKDGTIYVPSEWVFRSMVFAASSMKFRKGTLKRYALGNIDVSPIEIPLLDSHGKNVTTYEIDSRPVCIQRNRIIRQRPRFDGWTLNLCIEFNDKVFTQEIVMQVLVKAGEEVGIGDYRPRFGRFEVK